jgi:hypothetical protein
MARLPAGAKSSGILVIEVILKLLASFGFSLLMQAKHVKRGFSLPG